jgi:hypothetical protein
MRGLTLEEREELLANGPLDLDREIESWEEPTLDLLEGRGLVRRWVDERGVVRWLINDRGRLALACDDAAKATV